MRILMSILLFILLCIGIILSGGLMGVFLNIVTRKRKKNILEFFCETNYIYGKFTDQNEISIDEVVTHFKNLDFWLTNFLNKT